MTETKHYSYEEIREKIGELVPDVIFESHIEPFKPIKGYRTITLADVLMAIEKGSNNKYKVAVDEYGIFWNVKGLNKPEKLFIWNLEKHLSQQEQPVWDFIGSLII